MQYGSSGTGGLNHLACTLINSAIGANATYVPYRGGAPAMQDLIGGRIDFMCTSTPGAAPQIEGGQVKGLAVLAHNRSPRLPNLPSADEQGFTNVEADLWYAFFLPKGTPAAIVEKLNAATVATMNTPSVQTHLRDIGAELVVPERRSPQYLRKFVKSEIQKWANPIKAAGLVEQ
jgi:tripartite-type tricarboxylate transporter receptor subunit TctC